MRTFLGFLAAFSTIASAQTSLPNLFPYPNGSGLSETYNTNHKPLDLTGAFFQPLGTNGRSCASCHRPAEGWSISPVGVQLRFLLTQGADPIFHNNDGTNCDQHIDTSTIPGRRAASSLLLTRGLIRISEAVPANAEFTVVNVQNPYGCGDMSTLSLYRRPLPATNLKFLTTVMWDGRESSPQTGTQKITPSTNPNDLLADLAAQAIGAVTGHQQGSAPTDAQVQDIVNFETSLTTAQAFDYQIGELNADGANGGPAPIASQQFFVGINDSFPPSFGFNPSGAAFNERIFNLYDAWKNSTIPARASIDRGEEIFNTKQITITGVAGLNDTLGLASVTGTCGTCHDAFNVGNHSASVPINIGVGDLDSSLDVSYLPVITLQNNTTGEIVKTTDPGRAMVTGLWADIGKVKGPILRGLAARPPYFHNGSAMTLEDAVEFYNQRFSIGFTAQEKADLVAFLKSL